MAALLMCSLCVPRAFDEDGIAFGIAYLVLILTHAVGFAMFGSDAGLRGIRAIGPINVGGAILLLIAGWTHGAMDYVLWTGTAALFLFALVSPKVQDRFQIQVGHFAERHGLMILIVLGESLVSVGSAASGQQVDGRLVVGVLCGFLATAALWWSYFVGDDEAAVEAVGTAPAGGTRMAGVGYDLTHLVMIAGVIRPGRRHPARAGGSAHSGRAGGCAADRRRQLPVPARIGLVPRGARVRPAGAAAGGGCRRARHDRRRPAVRDRAATGVRSGGCRARDRGRHRRHRPDPGWWVGVGHLGGIVRQESPSVGGRTGRSTP